MTESVQGPERLAALLYQGASGEAQVSWMEMAKFLLAHGVSLPDSGDAPRAEPSEAAIEAAWKVVQEGDPSSRTDHDGFVKRLIVLALHAAYAVDRGALGGSSLPVRAAPEQEPT